MKTPQLTSLSGTTPAESGGDDERRTITMTTSSNTRTVAITKAQEAYVSWYVDVLIYTVVLNLFVEYSEAVKIDSFTISILTALLLKLILVFLERIEGRVHHYFRSSLFPAKSRNCMEGSWLFGDHHYLDIGQALHLGGR
jgi:hypothetical protein